MGPPPTHLRVPRVQAFRRVGILFWIDSAPVGTDQAQPPSLIARCAWLLLPTLAFAAIALSFYLMRAEGVNLPAIFTAAAVILGLGWILVSTLHPARADRTCPECGEEALKRLDPNTTRGVICASCGHEDADVSSWLFAEEETALEEIVLADRARAKTHRDPDHARPSTTTVETQGEHPA